MKLLIKCLALLALIYSTGCTSIDAVTGRETRNFFSMNEDIAMGEQTYQQFMQEAGQQGVSMNHDAQRVTELNNMIKRIGAVSHIPDLPYEVVLVHDDTVNAMATPGGKIIVFEGLYWGRNALVQNDDELAAVMAHEVAHANCRHSTEAMTRSMPMDLLLAGIGIYAAIEEDEDIALAVAGTAVLYHGLVATRYSRRDELEADAVGMMYMADAGYDPHAAVNLWKRACENSDGSPGFMNAFSTHPADQLRWQKLQERLPEAMQRYQASPYRRN